jgi:hypothetical protein
VRRWRWRSPLYRAPKPRPRPYPAIEVPGTGVTDLAAHLLAELAAVHPALRMRAHWVLDPYWLRYVKRVGGEPMTGASAAAAVDSPDVMMTILGVQAFVTDDGGWPHLEPEHRDWERLGLPKPPRFTPLAGWLE